MAFRSEVIIYSKRSGEQTFKLTLGVFPTREEAFRRMRQPWAVASYESTEGLQDNGTTMYFPPHRIKEYTITEV